MVCRLDGDTGRILWIGGTKHSPAQFLGKKPWEFLEGETAAKEAAYLWVKSHLEPYTLHLHPQLLAAAGVHRLVAQIGLGDDHIVFGWEAPPEFPELSPNDLIDLSTSWHPGEPAPPRRVRQKLQLSPEEARLWSARHAELIRWRLLQQEITAPANGESMTYAILKDGVFVFVGSGVGRSDHRSVLDKPFTDFSHDPAALTEALRGAAHTGKAAFLNNAGDLGTWWNELYGLGNGLIAVVAIRVPCCCTSLSDRELDVCILLGQGVSSADMPEKLGISRSAVDKHAANAKVKWQSNCTRCSSTCVISGSKKDLKIMCARHERGLLGLRKHRASMQTA
jgi:hypothetical protein